MGKRTYLMGDVRNHENCSLVFQFAQTIWSPSLRGDDQRAHLLIGQMIA